MIKNQRKKEKNLNLGSGFSYGIDCPERTFSWFDDRNIFKAPIGFEPMNQGFADPYNRPLCQGAMYSGKCHNSEWFMKIKQNFKYVKNRPLFQSVCNTYCSSITLLSTIQLCNYYNFYPYLYNKHSNCGLYNTYLINLLIT